MLSQFALSVQIVRLLMTVMLLPAIIWAQFSFGGYNFSSSAAFADHAEAVGSSLILPTPGSTVASALTDINLGTWVVSKNTTDFVDVYFRNNAIINESGADFVVFEYGTAESYKVAVSTNGTPGGLGTFISYNGTAAIDLSNHGVGAGATVTMLRIQPNVYGGTAELSADIQDIGALHSGDVPSVTDAFTFDDGTIQGWTLTGAYDETGATTYAHSFQFGWKDPVNFPNPPGTDPMGDQKGSLQCFTLSGHGINNPNHTWWIMQFHSPDLSALPAWQSAKGYSVEIAECMASVGKLYANLFVKVYDHDQAKDRYFYNGTAQELTHDIYGDGIANWNHQSFDWTTIQNFPTNYTIKEIYISLWGRLNTALEGGVYLDQVVPILGAMPQTPEPPSNLKVYNLGDQLHITWTDNSINETGFALEMKDKPSLNLNWQVLDSLAANVISYQMDNPYYQHTYHFRVRAFNEHGFSAYSNTDSVYVGHLLFTITILSPNGGEQWAPGSVHTVTWKNSGMLGKPMSVTLEYSTDNGSHWMPNAIATVLNTGSYDWTIPNTPSTQCILRVKDSFADTPYDLSNKPFTITTQTMPILSVSPLVLDFGTVEGQLSFAIHNQGGGTLTWNVSANPAKPWLDSYTPTSGSGDQTVTVKVDRLQLAADKDSTMLVVASNGGNLPVTVKIERAAGTLPEHWQFTDNTGQNAIIVLPTDAHPNIDGLPLVNQDVIGAFTTAGLCCGWKPWTGQNLSLTAWGDNDQTPAVDGFKAGETIHFRVFRLSTGTEWTNVEVGYSQGNGLYSANGFMILNKFNVHQLRTVRLDFSSGWNLFSINVNPTPAGMGQVMAPLGNKLVVVKDGLGHTYIPAYGINDIGDIDFENGYQAYLSAAAQLDVTGQPVAPTHPIPLTMGWNMKSYLPTVPINVDQALSSIAPHLVLAKNGAGQAYIPQYAINDIGQMQPGQGYQFYLKQAVTLVYPASTTAEKQMAIASTGHLIATSTQPMSTTAHFKYTANTGENAIVVIPVNAQPHYADGTPLAMGDEIGIFNQDNRCCGAGIWNNSNLAITVWGDNAMTDSTDGFTVGDTLRFRVWNSTNGLEYKAKVTFLEGHPVVYTVNGFSVVQQLRADQLTKVESEQKDYLPKGFMLMGNHPNPFNSETSIRFSLPSTGEVRIIIYDYRGEIVWQDRATFAAGQHQWRWHGQDRRHLPASSGVYFYQLTFAAKDGSLEKKFGKMVLMR